jgi:hypothetical protein
MLLATDYGQFRVTLFRDLEIVTASPLSPTVN